MAIPPRRHAKTFPSICTPVGAALVAALSARRHALLERPRHRQPRPGIDRIRALERRMIDMANRAATRSVHATVLMDDHDLA